MMRRIYERLLLCCYLLILSTIVVAQTTNDIKTDMQKMLRVMSLLDGAYVDTVNISKLTEDAIVKMLSDLDPHSAYISPDEVAKMNEPLEGEFEGVGVLFNILEDTLYVVNAIVGGPCEEVGVLSGDRIVAVDGENIAGIGLKNSDVFKLLRGEKGTRVELKILRRRQIIDFVVVRGKIPIYSIDTYYKLSEKTGYIKVNRFAATTEKEFEVGIKSLKEEGAKNLIIDLRRNGGGYLHAAFSMADHFIDRNNMVVYTEGRYSPRKEYRASEAEDFMDGRVVVIVDENSASASEIVSGAIQDWDRGLVVGRRTFGKGLVQQPYSLQDGSVIRLTTSHYYTPSGRCIQKPYDGGVKEYQKEYIDRFNHGEVYSKDSMQIDSSQQYFTLKYRRKVYGGGGIIPDVFVPIDTSSHMIYMNKILAKNLIVPKVLEYVDKHRNVIKQKYPSFDGFLSYFNFSEADVNSLYDLASSEGIERNAKSEAFVSPYVRNLMKALLARSIYGFEYFTRVENTDDKDVMKALEVIESPEYNSILNGER
ncbi:MAG: S41 family peptidase [Bacteroidales bacterium]